MHRCFKCFFIEWVLMFCFVFSFHQSCFYILNLLTVVLWSESLLHTCSHFLIKSEGKRQMFQKVDLAVSSDSWTVTLAPITLEVTKGYMQLPTGSTPLKTKIPPPCSTGLCEKAYVGGGSQTPSTSCKSISRVRHHKWGSANQCSPSNLCFEG